MERRVTILPELVKSRYGNVEISGVTYPVVYDMSEILSGGTGGNSKLTDLSIPIFLKNDYRDLGFYNDFDGYMLQESVVNNFVYSSTTAEPFKVILTNTSDVDFKKYLRLSPYIVDWGDGNTDTFQLNDDTFTPLTHQYPSTNGNYTITVTQQNPWGVTEVKKKVKLPYDIAYVPNTEGTATFTPNQGSWSGIPLNMNYINSYDENGSQNLTSGVNVVSGRTQSRITELRRYGSNPYPIGQPMYKFGEVYGVINSVSNEYTGYTIDNVDYYDYRDGSSVFVFHSSGLTAENTKTTKLVKDERLKGFSEQPEIQSNVFIERDKTSGFESLMRLGEIDNMGDLEKYGYKYFKLNKDGVR